MATTLYFALNTAAAREPGTYPVAATNYANVTPTRAVTTEGCMIPYPWRAVANLTQSSLNSTAAQTAKFGRFFSAPFAEDYVYTHPLNSAAAIQYYMADYQSNLSANHCVQQCYIFVWRPSTGAVVGVIQPVTTIATGTKEPTATASIQSTRGSYFAASAGTINILKGDILVFEPFATYTQAAATAYTVRFYYGGSTEITAENTVVATPASKVVFSVDLPLEMPIGAVTGAIQYKAINELRGARFVSILSSRARLTSAPLVDGSPFISRLKARASSSANLTTQVLLSSTLKSVSKSQGWRQQEHPLSMALQVRARSIATFPDRSVGDALALYYSHTGNPDNPALSLGGKRGVSFGGVSFSASPMVPGVQVLSVHRMRPGSHTLHFNAATRTVSLVMLAGLLEYTAAVAPSQSTVVVGSREAGFAVVQIDAGAMTTSNITLDVTLRRNTLFPDPSLLALGSGETQYRCLYLFNDTDQEVANVQLAVQDDSVDTVTVASEFTSDVSLAGFSSMQTPRSIHHRALDPTGWGGVFFMENAPQMHSEISVNSLPVILAAPATTQASDGDTIQTPMLIEDVYDSQGRLGGLTFGPSLAWPKIPPRRGVTFWVRRVQPPTAPDQSIATALFTVTADF